MAAGLEGIDDVDWASLSHAYGSAEDFPQTLRDAVGDDEPAEEAAEHLFSSIIHQGTLYSATPHAVPFLARLATATAMPRRETLVGLLAGIAASDDAASGDAASGDAAPEVLADVGAVLAREAPRLLSLLDDVDAEIRHCATYLLGHLPCSCAAEVVPALRARRAEERSPRVAAGLLAAAGRLDPRGSAAWLAEEAAGRSAAVRAGALWAIAANDLPWPDAAPHALARCWAEGEPLKGWAWADDPFGDIAARLDAASFSAVAGTLLDRGSADSARTAVNAAYDRCVRSRSAHAESVPLPAAAIRHPDSGVRFAAMTAIRDVREAAVASADSLAALAAAPPRNDDSLEARVSRSALETLIDLGDPRWREPFIAALGAGAVDSDILGLLADSGVPADPGLLAAVRERLATVPLEEAPDEGGYDAHLGRMRRHNEVNALTRLLRHWGPAAADAVPELLRLVPYDDGVPYDGWWATRALAAIGPAASAAVPGLTLVRDDPDASWRRRLGCAQTLAAITGDTAQLTARIAEAAAEGEAVLAAEAALKHGLPLDGPLPALRDVATAAGGDGASDVRRRLDAARLLLRAGETEAPLRAIAEVHDGGRTLMGTVELAGLLGPDAASFVPRLRQMLGGRFGYLPAALAIRRITGEAAPLVDAVRRWLASMGAGPQVVEALRELGADAAPLLPGLRELVDGDDAVPGVGAYGRQVRGDEEQRRELAAVLAELPG
ncbi:hypothetical protein ABTW95_02145 [Spirillospora sp. NPDC127506]